MLAALRPRWCTVTALHPVSDSGSEMGAAPRAQVRSDAVTVTVLRHVTCLNTNHQALCTAVCSVTHWLLCGRWHVRAETVVWPSSRCVLLINAFAHLRSDREHIAPRLNVGLRSHERQTPGPLRVASDSQDDVVCSRHHVLSDVRYPGAKLVAIRNRWLAPGKTMVRWGRAVRAAVSS